MPVQSGPRKQEFSSAPAFFFLRGFCGAGGPRAERSADRLGPARNGRLENLGGKARGLTDGLRDARKDAQRQVSEFRIG